ncbi:hypothetical protein ILYODFUR_006550 [Ilyodon furcidens]|uniref:Uncharacterized protein n=1 Tax=Ilyodon furcidens TaxID=33524 RepID=A0ABV0TVE7_9TELE
MEKQIFLSLLGSVFLLLGVSPVSEAKLWDLFSFASFPAPPSERGSDSSRSLCGEVAVEEGRRSGFSLQLSPVCLPLLPHRPGDRVAEPRRKTCNPALSSSSSSSSSSSCAAAQQINKGSKWQPSTEEPFFTSSICSSPAGCLENAGAGISTLLLKSRSSLTESVKISTS